jgi:hypothetical protein
MASNKTLLQLRARVRQTCDIEGTSGVQRHPNTEVDILVNVAAHAFKRVLDEKMPEQRSLMSNTFSTVVGTEEYALPAAFKSLLSVELTADGSKSWLLGYELHERAALTDPQSTYTGIPMAYAVVGDNISLLPVPQGVYTVKVLYTPAQTELANDNSQIDVIEGMDDFIVWHASKGIAKKDRLWDLHSACDADLQKITGDLATIARNRDMNNSPRVMDVSMANRFGVRRGWGRKY